MKRWLWRGAWAGLALAAIGVLIAASGVIPIKASSGHWPVTEWFLRFSMKRSIATHSLTIKVPGNLDDPALVRKGAGHYDVGCRSCHGEPGMPQPRVAAHMLPVPPALPSRIRESDPRKLFYVVKHGLKFTAMPAWPSPYREDEVWAMVAFLLKYPQLDAAGYRRLTGRDELASPTGEELTASSRARAVVAQSCVRCHGRDGMGHDLSTMPRLAGQRAAYLRNALGAFAAGRRHSGIMEPAAAAVGPDVAAEIADYYARLRPPAGAGAPARSRAEADESVAGAIARGRVIAEEGIREQRVPACLECHGASGRRGKPEYPLLAGQPADYLELQLRLFRENRRGGSDHAHLMMPTASRLKPRQARDVAQYFASLPPPVPATAKTGRTEP